MPFVRKRSYFALDMGCELGVYLGWQDSGHASALHDDMYVQWCDECYNPLTGEPASPAFAELAETHCAYDPEVAVEVPADGPRASLPERIASRAWALVVDWERSIGRSASDGATVPDRPSLWFRGTHTYIFKKLDPSAEETLKQRRWRALPTYENSTRPLSAELRPWETD